MPWARKSSPDAPRVAVTNTKTISSSAATLSYIDVTDLAVTISPTTATTKILVTAHIAVGLPDSHDMFLRVLRGSTSIGNGSSGDIIALPSGSTQNSIWVVPFVFLDSPATTSATTYKVQFTRAGGAGTVYINRRAYAADYTASSTISVMEVRT